jgi:hypothetical protein
LPSLLVLGGLVLGALLFLIMNEKVNYDGVKFGMLTVLKDGKGLYEGKQKRRSVVCKCDCGNTKEILLRQIIRNKQKSCGCLASPKTEVNQGDSFGLWKVIEETGGYFKDGKKLSRTFEVECVCGKHKEVSLQSLKNGESKSCGCRGKIREEKIKKEKIIPKDTEEEQWKQSINYPKYYISTLGRLFHYESQIYVKAKDKHEVKKDKKYIYVRTEMYLTFIGEYDDSYLKVYGDLNINSLYLHYNAKIRSRFRNTYRFILYRCDNKECPAYPTYGAKGIKTEGSFKTLEGFLDWVLSQGIRGDEKLEIDRIDSTKGYYPENCRFITKEENILRSLNLSEGDVRFIRSNSFDWGLHREKYNCSDYTIKNIIEYKTFKGVI